MPLRQIMPEPYQLVVNPKATSKTTNQMGDKTRSDDPQVVIRGATSIRTMDTKEVINPAYLDRVVTHVLLAVLNPTEWRDGDLVQLPYMGNYRVDGDSHVSNLGPISIANHLFGGSVRLKRVN